MSEVLNDTTTTKKNSGHGNLAFWILGAIIAALIVGFVFPHFAKKLALGGEIFLNLLKMIVVPLVITSVMSGIIGLGDVRKLGKPGAAAIGYYLITTLLAVIVGIIVVNVIQPGAGMAGSPEVLNATAEGGPVPKSADGPQTVGELLRNLTTLLFTDNLLKSAIEVQLLPLIIFSIIFAAILTMHGTKSETLTRLINQANDALMDFVLLLMKIAPLGIFCLVAARFGEANAEGQLMTELQSVGKYMAAVLTGLSIHGFVTLPLILWFFTRRNPYRFIGQMSKALETAFSTASSSATLPVTIESAIDEAGVSPKSVKFVTPLGATINMDGTALYEAVAAIFIAQAFGIHLDLTQQIIVAITATLAAIGAAGIPEAGLITMLIVLKAVNLPNEGMALIISVDWLLDRFRTTINVLGDAMGAAVVEKALPPEAESEVAF
ncbi:MAG: dicarboxylate/amino acid:cation symporter [Verrucomicrobiae bacterium]|nr:dicarboxylate/amino acid:cation symporter [Verrucomicrobiae bacterium]